MVLEYIFCNCSNIRRKAYHVDNPVQAKRSSGYLKMPPPSLELRRSSTPNGAVRKWEILFHPELRYACTGLSTFKTYGLIFEKQSCKMRSFEHYLNLLK